MLLELLTENQPYLDESHCSNHLLCIRCTETVFKMVKGSREARMLNRNMRKMAAKLGDTFEDTAEVLTPAARRIIERHARKEVRDAKLRHAAAREEKVAIAEAKENESMR